jgi:hypothetical protein
MQQESTPTEGSATTASTPMEKLEIELQKQQKGNFVSEWFGQRIYPIVRLTPASLDVQKLHRCPFLTKILAEPRECIKSENSRGVCTINSSSNGPRQDWLVCPYRVIDSNIVTRSCKLIFGLDHDVSPRPVTVLKKTDELELFKEEIRKNGQGYVFFQDKLGGEISVDGSDRSPEISFDVTLVEVKVDGDDFVVTRYGILELQTMDFHGSYKGAVKDLSDAFRLHKKNFPKTLQENLEWSGQGVEGPNIANVFKRTFYQVMLKFKLSAEGAASAGTVLALPRAVWDSWQPFLGAPELEDAPEPEGALADQHIKRFVLPKASSDDTPEPQLNAFICVFDLDSSQPAEVSPVKIDHFVRVSPERLAHHAFTQVPKQILLSIGQGPDSKVLARIRQRLLSWWPDMTPSVAKVKATAKKKRET